MNVRDQADAELARAINARDVTTIRRWLAVGATAAAPLAPPSDAIVAIYDEDPVDFALWQLELELDGAMGTSDSREAHLEWATRIATHLVDVVGALDLGNLDVARRLTGMVRAHRVKPTAVVRPPTEHSRLIDALTELLLALKSIGEGYDAIDRGYHEAADRLHGGAPRRAREAWALAPAALSAVLPDLAESLSTGTLDLMAWWQYVDRIEAALAQARASAPSA